MAHGLYLSSDIWESLILVKLEKYRKATSEALVSTWESNIGPFVLLVSRFTQPT